MPPPDLGPLSDPRAARPVVGEIEGLRDDLWSRGVAKVLLAGAGGVGVAAEALAGPGARLIVLDGTDPVQLDQALLGDLDATVLVVSVPPGADTAGVEIVWDAVVAGFVENGVDPAARVVLVVPPGSPLIARAGGAPVVPGPADLFGPSEGEGPGGPGAAGERGGSGGRGGSGESWPGAPIGPWAALTPYVLVPAGLAGADVGALLRDATAPSATAPSATGPAAPLGTVVAGGAPNAPLATGGAGRGGPEDRARQLGDELGTCAVVELAGPLAEVLAQLLGALPGPAPRPDTVGSPAPAPHRYLAHPVDEVHGMPAGCASGPLVLTVGAPAGPRWPGPGVLTVGPDDADIPTSGPVSAQLLLWQRAVAHARGVRRAAGVPPPPARPVGDDTTATALPRSPDRCDDTHPHADGVAQLHSPPDTGPVTDGAVEIRAPWPVATLVDALDRLVAGAGTLAVHAHLDRHDDASAALLRTELQARVGLPTAFGWGARTAPLADAVVQVTGAGPAGPAADHQLAEAADEAAALQRGGIRVLRLHLTDRLIGLVGLVRAVQDLGDGRT